VYCFDALALPAGAHHARNSGATDVLDEINNNRSKVEWGSFRS